MACTHLLLGCILVSLFLQLQPLHALSSNCTTASISLTTDNITTTDASFSCIAFTSNMTSSSGAALEAIVNCSVKASFDSKAAEHKIASDATYLCSATTFSGTAKASATTSTSVAANCSGLFNTSALNGTATDIDGTSSCSIDITTFHKKPIPDQKSDLNTTVDCIIITATSAINETVTTTAATSVCSVVSVLTIGPSITSESVATSKCSSFSTTTIDSNHTSVTQALESCSIESTMTTSPPNSSSHSFLHGAILPRLT